MADSKDAARKEEGEVQQGRVVAAILRHCALNVLERDLTIQTEVELFKQMGNTAETATFMAIAQSFSGLGEFLLNPFFAQLADRFGRKPFINMLCAYSIIGNAILATDPFATIGKVPFVVINRALTGLLSSQSGSVMGTNALSDVSSGSQLGINLASMSGHFGFGMVAGPFLGNRALKAGGHVAVYRVRVVMALSHLIHNLMSVPETLLAAKRTKAISLQGLNPFGFLKLLMLGDVPLLSRLCQLTSSWNCRAERTSNSHILFLRAIALS
jgi:MFS family permease